MYSTSQLKSFLAFLSPTSLSLYRDSYTAESKPIFIGGCGRSGTTLLRIVLGVHSQFYAGPELNIHTNLIHNLEDKYPYVPKKAYLLYDKKKIKQLSEEFDISQSDIRHIRNSTSCLAGFINLFMNRVAKTHDKPRWIEKTPKNVTILPFLFEYFPKARFIHVIRDGRDVACSLRHHPKYKRVNGEKVRTHKNRLIRNCTDRWINDVSAGLEYRDDPRYYEVRYEHFVRAPKDTLSNLLDFLEVSFEEKLLSHHEHADDEPAFFLPSQNAVEPINDSSVGRWKTDLSQKEAQTVERKAGDLLRRLRYTEDKSWVSEVQGNNG